MNNPFVGALIILVTLAGFSLSISGQPPDAKTLNEILSQQTKFVPKDELPCEQLIEVGHTFRIPMGIEWLDEKNGESLAPLDFHGGTVRNLIEAIVRRSSEHVVSIEDRIVLVYSSSAFSSPFNFLNMRIPEYSARDLSLLGAEASLRHSINVKLYPELYKHGWNGGYGCGCPREFWDQNITFSGTDMTIREILNSIVESREKFLWVVRLSKDELIGDKPKWVGVPINEFGQSPISSKWRFILLHEEHPEPGQPGGGSGTSP